MHHPQKVAGACYRLGAAEAFAFIPRQICIALAEPRPFL